MSDRVIDIIARVITILMVFTGFHLMKRELGFETVVLFAFALTLVELYTKQNKDE
tara:strand:- start:123 stop:287 length:165 start_codon:yes stop_codon:yes gene_type:complete